MCFLYLKVEGWDLRSIGRGDKIVLVEGSKSARDKVLGYVCCPDAKDIYSMNTFIQYVL